ncbi:HEAT repeat domain-containing protein [Amycolatopsis methanolica]|uniref:HEAT repeat domain-containing protein n=1 Tax=Amycolatopsis methanolica TaxID=1814 RepID=UPI0003755DE9|nr:HEAT repeat domain-containing protein [Amycolatopsis methanolica]
MLAIRAADWVPQVRERARRECLRHLFRDPMTAVDLFPFACLLRPRAQGEWLAETLEGMLRTPEIRSAALASPGPLTRRAVYGSGHADVGELTAGLLDTDLKIRLTCADALAGSTDPEVLRLLRTSGTAALRTRAIRGPADALPALADPASLVRAYAQFILRRAGEDPAPQYRELVTTAASPGAVAGLGETGTEADGAVLLPLLADPRPKVRAETVRALRHLRVLPVDRLAPLLGDPSPRVARQVVLALRGCATEIDEAALRRMLDPGQPGHRRRNAFQLLSARDTWTRLALDLRLLLGPNEPLRETAHSDLRNWFAHGSATTYTAPGGERAAELRDLLSRAEPLLGATHARVLRLFL